MVEGLQMDRDHKTCAPTFETLDRLAAVVGEMNALRGSDETAPFLSEPRGRYHGKTAMVLRPANTAEVSQILQIANETGTAIVPQGGNTGLVGGQIPFETGHEVVLSLSRMSKIVEADADGNTITVEAGAVLRDVQLAAEAVDRLFPLSLASEGNCQIGGNLASNAGGVHVLAYGNARDLTLGLEVVLADGRVWNGLKKLRKDNSGYDLKDLFVGSEGTLGVITRAVLKLFPRPSEKTTVFCGLQELEHVARLFASASKTFGPSLTAFELMPRIGTDFLMRHMSMRDPLSTAFPWYALLDFSAFGGDSGVLGRAEALLEAVMQDGIVGDAVIAASISQAEELWRLRESMSEVQRLEGGSIKHDVSVPVAQISEFICRAGDIVEAMIPGARPVPFGHFGDGNIHYNVSQPADMDKDKFLANWDALNEAVYGLALELGGSVSAEHGIGRMKRNFLARTKDPSAIEMMHALKTSLDPNGILNPGKLV